MSVSALQIELVAAARARRARLFGTPVRVREPQPIPKDVKKPAPIRAVLKYAFPIGPGQVFGRDILNIAVMRPTGHDIMRKFCEKHGVTVIEMCSNRRQHDITKLRHELCWILRQETTMTLPMIGRMLGGKDHTTIMNSIKQHQAFLDNGSMRPQSPRQSIYVPPDVAEKVLAMRALRMTHREIAAELGITVPSSVYVVSRYNRRQRLAAVKARKVKAAA